MSEKRQIIIKGFSFSGTLFFIFLVLKLTDKIDWSWWWITSPLWIGWALGLIVFIIIGIILLTLTLTTNRYKRRLSKKK